MPIRPFRLRAAPALLWAALAAAQAPVTPPPEAAVEVPVGPAIEPPAAVTQARLEAILAGDDPVDAAELRALQAHVQALVARVLPATVSLGGASGALVERDGELFVLCAAHVTETAGQPVPIVLEDGRRLQGTSLGADHRSDVSLIRVTGGLSTGSAVPTVAIGRSSALRVGEWVVMLGHPGGRKNGRSAPVRLGRVLREPGTGYLVTDCTMQGGDSGGPLVDMQGKVVGINSRIDRPLHVNMHAPIDALEARWDDLVAGAVTEARRGRRGPRVGFGVALEWGDDGAVVGGDAPSPDAPAAGRERLLAGDRLLRVDDRDVGSPRRLRFALRRVEPGQKVRVTVQRDGAAVALEVEVVREGRR